MKKDTFYFPHDYNTRTDHKIKKLIRKHGATGYGVYWMIIEDLYNNANELHLDCDCIAFDLRVDCEVVKSIIYDFDLFEINDDYFGSRSVKRRLDERFDKSEKARESADLRWKKVREAKVNDATAMHSECEPNAIKEKKGKEKKGKETFIEPKVEMVLEYMITYDKVLIGVDKAGIESQKYIDYWNEKSWMRGRNKMKDWKAATRNWLANWNEKQPTKKPTKYLGV